MADQYLLACECGNNVVIEPRLAGGEVDCTCGKTLRVPTLREMRRLPSANPTKASRSPATAPQWSPWQGILLVVGVLMIVVSVARLGYVTSQFMRLPAAQTEQEFVQQDEEDIDAASPIQCFLVWRNLVFNGLDEGVLPPEFKAVEMAKTNMIADLKRWAAVLGVGVAMIAVSVVVGGRPRTD